METSDEMGKQGDLITAASWLLCGGSLLKILRSGTQKSIQDCGLYSPGNQGG